MTKPMFAKVCAVLQTIPSQVKWDDSIAVVYATAMRDWSDEVVGAIMDYVIRTCEFRPTVAELRKIGIKLFDPTLSHDAIYDEIKRILIMVSPPDRAKYVDSKIAQGRIRPEIRSVVEECGGWYRLSLMDTPDVRAKVREAVAVVHDQSNFDHIFIRPNEGPALERGRRALEAVEQ